MVQTEPGSPGQNQRPGDFHGRNGAQNCVQHVCSPRLNEKRRGAGIGAARGWSGIGFARIEPVEDAMGPGGLQQPGAGQSFGLQDCVGHIRQIGEDRRIRPCTVAQIDTLVQIARSEVDVAPEPLGTALGHILGRGELGAGDDHRAEDIERAFDEEGDGIDLFEQLADLAVLFFLGRRWRRCVQMRLDVLPDQRADPGDASP